MPDEPTTEAEPSTAADAPAGESTGVDAPTPASDENYFAEAALAEDDLDADEPEAPVADGETEGAGEGEGEAEGASVTETTQSPQPGEAEGETPPTTPAPEDGTAPPPAPEAPAAPTPPVPPTEVQPQVPQQPPAEVRPEPTQPSAAPQPTVAEMRAQAEDTLATQHYALNQEQVDEFDADPASFIAKLSARVYMDAVTNSLTHVLQSLPQLVEHTLKQHDVVEAEEVKFFEAWPKLSTHREDVVTIAQVYRQLHPQATSDQFIRDVGAQTMVALKLTVDAPAAAQPQPAQPQPFVPAAASPPAGASPPPTNPFEQMALEEDVLDMD